MALTLYYLVTQKHRYTMDLLRSAIKHPLLQSFHIVPYEKLLKSPPSKLPDGAYIFSDIERLTYPDAVALSQYWNELAGRGNRCKVLNHPIESMRRQPLLQSLHTLGINDFNVYPIDKFKKPKRWPVFLRDKNDHVAYDDIGLIHSQSELTTAIQKLNAQKKSITNLLIVEFCPTTDSTGTYRKYGAFSVGGIIVARHLFFSKQWVLRRAENTNTHASVAEEMEFITTNPHAHAVRQIFSHAKIDYGRMDYSLLGNRIQVWEINTNPLSIEIDDFLESDRIHAQRRFAENFLGALTLLLNPTPHEKPSSPQPNP